MRMIKDYGRIIDFSILVKSFNFFKTAIYSIYNYRIKLNIKNIAIKKYYKYGKEYLKKIRTGVSG